VNRRTTIGFFPWRFVDGESSIGRCVAFLEDAEYDELMAKKAALPVTKFGDAYDPARRAHQALSTRGEARSWKLESTAQPSTCHL
jgi:arylformamidase